jgi:hypothetical protein
MTVEKTYVGLAFVLLIVLLFVLWNPIGRGIWNVNQYAVQKVDDATRYSTRKKVEDSCRAMIASYTSDKLKYQQYATSDSAEQRSWGEQAKMRANQTAASYNEFIMKNSFVFEGNIPKDICTELEYLT